MTSLIIGATGLVGNLLLRKLAKKYQKVYVVSRSQVDLPENCEVCAFDEAKNINADDFFNCLGTTIKKAGSKNKFHNIDVGIPLKVLQDNPQIKRVFNISSIGADSRGMSFYLRCKGELEESFNQAGKKAVFHYRPSTLDGKREENRPWEKVALVSMRSFRHLPLLKIYAPTRVDDLIQQVLKDCDSSHEGVIVRSTDILN